MIPNLQVSKLLCHLTFDVFYSFSENTLLDEKRMADEEETCHCIGIDLGTSNSLVGVSKHKQKKEIYIELLTSLEGIFLYNHAPFF